MGFQFYHIIQNLSCQTYIYSLLLLFYNYFRWIVLEAEQIWRELAPHYFVQGGCGQVLDNAHGNVYFGVPNGTACTMHSLAWDDPEDKKDAHNR